MSRFLAWVVTILLLLLVLEGITRLLTTGTALEPDPRLGWTYQPELHQKRTNDGVTWDFRTSRERLRLPEGYGLGPKKPGEHRVLLLGDSFTLGWMLELDETFASALEERLAKEGRAATVVPVGVEGFSTDQQCVWLETRGAEYAPDLVVVLPYPNDVVWNAKPRYFSFAKPLYAVDAAGNAAAPPAPVADERGLLVRVSRLWSKASNLLLAMGAPIEVPGGGRLLPDDAVFLRQELPDVAAGWKATGAVAKRLVEKAKALGAKVAAAPIPNRFEMQPGDGSGFAARFGVSPGSLDFGAPTRRLGETFAAAGATLLDTRARIAPPAGARHYFEGDWHFNPAGAKAFGDALYEELAKAGLLPPASTARATAGLAAAAEHAPKGGIPTWAFVVAGIWVALSIGFRLAYPDESVVASFLKVGALLATVVAVFAGITKGAALLPGGVRTLLILGLVLSLVIYAIVKTRSRFGTIRELFGALVDRGHWYLVPMLVVMLTISVLLVVAQNPIVAPFIYTLF